MTQLRLDWASFSNMAVCACFAKPPKQGIICPDGRGVLTGAAEILRASLCRIRLTLVGLHPN